MKNFTTYFVLLFLIQHIAKAQITCKTSEIHQQALLNDKVYKEKYESTRQYLKDHDVKQFKTVGSGASTEFHVPVVVHVMHTGGSIGSNYNPTDIAINNFLNHINEGFSNTNDVAAVPGTYNSINFPIRFYLAQRDELSSCSATTGINRMNLSSNSTYVADGVGSPGITDASLKAIVHWNDLDYYNIYIVNKIDGEDGYTTTGSFTAGYAYYPLLGGYQQDGMVVLAQQVNFTNSVFIHEMGHSFDLIHPFEGGSSTVCPSNADCTTDNDEVCDTDPIRLSFTCNPSGTNPCGGTWATSTTQFNYMAYNGCTDRFTPGQAIRINNTLNLIRSGYKNSAGVDAPPTSLPTVITPTTINPANASNLFDMGPSYVGFNSIDFPSSGYSYEGDAGFKAYVDRTCNQATTLVKNNSYPISIKTKLNSQKVRVYIDYNNDGTFGTTAPELVFSNNGGSGNVTHSGTVTVPATGVVFNTPLRMRVIADNAATITPTMQLNNGQAEDYTITVLNAALPVTWRNFAAKIVANNFVDLTWSTDIELYNDFFEVERSSDGYVFNNIYKVNGQENKFTPSYYSFTDQNANNGINYYRIKQTDKDGKTSFSKTEIVMLNPSGLTASIYPNPINDNMKISVDIAEKDYIEYAILDINGQILLNNKTVGNIGNNLIDISTQQLPTGVYILKIKTKQVGLVKRIIKN